MTNERRRDDAARQLCNYVMERLISPSSFNRGVPFRVRAVQFIAGPRVLISLFDVGFDAERLQKRLAPASISHIVPSNWPCEKRPPVSYSYGRFVAIEAIWPDGLGCDDIQLKDVSNAALSGDRIAVGQNQVGTLICFPSSKIEHVLVAGQTGSGKTYTMRSLGAQLSLPRRHGAPSNRLVLIDGKRGDGLGIINGVPGQVGPLAICDSEAINALGWVVDEMHERYDWKERNKVGVLPDSFPHIHVLVDEFQIWTYESNNPVVTALMNRIATQGRGAWIHLIAATQKPVVGVFGRKGIGSTTADQFSATIGQRVKSAETSRVVVGGSYPRCDLLLNRGDSYVIAKVPDSVMERVQVAYITESDLQRMAGGELDLDEYPEFDPSVLGEKVNRGRPTKLTSDREWAYGLEAVIRGEHRDWYQEQFESPAPGSSRARAILSRCKEIVNIMRNRGVRCLGE